MPKVFIDGIEYECEPGANMLEVALDNKLDLPYFCWHPTMHSVGACRQCAVKAFKDESDTTGKIVMACMTPAVEGTRVSINDSEAAAFRRFVIELLMTNHPHDCPVCDEGGECHLQDMTTMTGHVYREFRGKKRTYNDQDLGPLVNHEMNRCIQCWRCVRFYRDMAGGRDFGVFGSRNRVYFGRQEDGVLESEFSGNLVEVCPTGVFTDKTLKQHYTRKWDLETAPSVCIHCGLGCNTIPGARYGTLRRIRARYNSDVNGYFICDRGRYGYEFINCESRIKLGSVKGGRADAVGQAQTLIKNAKRVIGIGSPRASLESNYALKMMVGEESFSTGLSQFEQSGAELALSIMTNGTVHTPSLAEVQQADVVLILGADPTNEAPMLDYAIRQGMNRARLDISRSLKIPDWDASAVATALQGAKGSLFVVAPWLIKLNEIAVESQKLSFSDIGRLGAEIADKMRSGQPLDDSSLSHAISALTQARQPLIVTSISAGKEVLRNAAMLAEEINKSGKDCWLSMIVPEANTLGTALLGGMSVDEAIGHIESGRADTLVVLENDLFRRVDSEKLGNALQAANVISLDCIETSTSIASNVVLPVPAYVETDGTFINNEGRAQRFYQVFAPKRPVLHTWQIIEGLWGETRWAAYADVLRAISNDIPALSGIIEAAPPAEWRSNAEQKVPRMPHRFSGRTSMHANKTIREPQPPSDPDTPFAFSMEGDHNVVPGPLDPRFWWPGWNSNNSVTKFQTEVNGPLQGGNSGKRLIEPTAGKAFSFAASIDILIGDQVWLIPQKFIFGSEELSSFSPGIAELAPEVTLRINSETAARLGFADGDMARIDALNLIVKLDDRLGTDVATIPAGFAETAGINSPRKAKLERVQ